MISAVALSDFEKNLISKKGIKAIYFNFGLGTLYSVSNEKGETVSLISVKVPSAYLIFEKTPSEDEKAEITEFLKALKIKETVSEEKLFEDMEKLFICEFEGEEETEKEMISEATGRDYDLCYNLLTSVGFVLPEKDEYYVTSFERAKLGLKTYIIKDENNALSTAAVLGEGESGALIGAVATSKLARNRGYASKIVLHAASCLKKAKKTPLITYFDEKAGKIYKSIGFKVKEIVYIQTEKRS